MYKLISRMKKQFSRVAVFSFYVLMVTMTFGQSEPTNEKQTAPLTYQPTSSHVSSYSVVLNVDNIPISHEINLQMNLHRRFEEDYVWKVNDKLWILLKPFNTHPQPNEHENE